MHGGSTIGCTVGAQLDARLGNHDGKHEGLEVQRERAGAEMVKMVEMAVEAVVLCL